MSPCGESGAVPHCPPPLAARFPAWGHGRAERSHSAQPSRSPGGVIPAPGPPTVGLGEAPQVPRAAPPHCRASPGRVPGAAGVPVPSVTRAGVTGDIPAGSQPPLPSPARPRTLPTRPAQPAAAQALGLLWAPLCCQEPTSPSGSRRREPGAARGCAEGRSRSSRAARRPLPGPSRCAAKPERPARTWSSGTLAAPRSVSSGCPSSPRGVRPSRPPCPGSLSRG